MAGKIKLALIGTGNIAQHHIKPNGDPKAKLFENEEADFVAVVDINHDRATAFADKFGIAKVYTNADEMLAMEVPDIVCIATPPFAHAPLSIKAMEAGAWVLCEKPLCGSLRELDEIQEVEKRTGKFCSSVFQFRFGSAVQHIKQVVDEQIAGKLTAGICHTTWYRDAEYYKMDWRGTWKDELGGPTMGHGIHAMDTFLWTMGPWHEVRAMCSTIDRDIEVEDTSSASVLFENGAIGSVFNSILCPQEATFLRYDMQQGSIWTENALYALSNAFWRFKTLDLMSESNRERFATIPTDVQPMQSIQLCALVRDFQAGHRPLVSGDQVRNTIEFITSIYKSSATGEPVRRGSILPGDPFYENVGGSYAKNCSH